MQSRLSAALGVSAVSRTETVTSMLRNNARRAPGYWLQLVLAMGIATLGLVLSSTAVVIGAMLVSPLMGPILELGMGFAVGSSLLVLRAFLRVALSVLTVIGGAALMTLALPFHEVTPEIAARTAPTLLDLLIAAFCALTAAYTTVRQTAETTAAAAGTAIGIALVPPLCVIGYGLGTGSAAIAGGASLLFTANFSAILVLAVLSFLALGYDRIVATTLEHEYLERPETYTERAAARAHAALGRVFGSRFGTASRVLIPAVFLVAVAVPLRHALEEVSWQVRVQSAIRRAVDAERPRPMQTSVAIDRPAVALRLLVVGTEEQATSLERRLQARIAAAAGVTPSVTVTAVPDARLLAASARQERAGAPEPPRVDAGGVAARVGGALATRWPAAAAGPLVEWQLVLADSTRPVVAVHHLGAPLGAAGEALLADELGRALGTAVAVADEPVPAQPIVATPGNELAWLAAALPVLERAGRATELTACVAGPARRGRRSGSKVDDVVRQALAAWAAGRESRLVIDTASIWSIRVAQRTCATAPAAADSALPVGRRPASSRGDIGARPP